MTYELSVKELRTDFKTNVPYIVACDDAHEYRIYNVFKAQLDDLPQTLYVTPKSIDCFGKVIFKQDERKVFSDHYKIGDEYNFHFDDIKTDYNTQNKFYVISDDFADHRYYLKGDTKKHQIGDDCLLRIKGLNDKGFLQFEEVDNQPIVISKTQELSPSAIPKPTATHCPNTLNVDENTNIELKTSIVFPPDNNGLPDIDHQLFNIVREIASFMNAKGGTLYIGVHDITKEILGIENDYSHLNEGKTTFTYHPNKDGYELRIRDAVNDMCNGLANSLIEIKFEDCDSHTYCIVEVSQASRPIWVCGKSLFTRTGNRVTPLFGEDITSFIYQKSSYSILDKIDFQDAFPSMSQEAITDIVNATMKLYINENKPKPTTIKVPDNEIEYYIVWKQDRTWCRQKAKSSATDLLLQLPVRKADHDSLLIFCYANGKVNEVELTDFKSGTRLNETKKKGFSDESPLCNIFLAHKSSFLAVYSKDEHGTSMVKVHHVSDINTTASPSNKGSLIIPTSGTPELYKLISGAYVKIIKDLIMPKSQTSQSFGVPVNSSQQNISEEISFLNNL